MKLTLNIPQSWDELSTSQLIKIASYFKQQKTGKELQLLVYLTLVNAKWYQFKKWYHALKVLRYMTLNELAEHYSWVFLQTDRTKFIPTIKVKKEILFAPGNRLHNITIEEFALCEDFFFHYNQTNNVEYLRYIAAILYREKQNNHKIEFIKWELDERYKTLSKIPKKQLYAIGLCYKGSTLEIQTMYPHVFKKTTATTTTTTKQPEPPGLGKVINSFAGGKFGNLWQTKRTNVHDFLAEFNNQLNPMKHANKRLL
jgi:hypothetical protein